ncbi:glycerol-3-phosphate 1-O-acyltransferase PlsY [Bacillus hwajinpoensis]|uniref:Glycerol-3-phosphate acyltransferase n=1 Tax=Guptibacillus hwajinpoensis TaxID=208199 RepID=A0A845EXU8_9BACL|nr:MULTISPECIES: glycerol-3-phosphate 1-O-acyltransferase PlsY [Bacillaceae]MYL63359.1 glycerol-3-phosphate 1-O-acyltransferase PlsY [Pseudalkalibacillus hwajinpoensis]PFG13636.1 acyl-phosphate glycerol-3-phosphate acyltransferase [Bacillus sp. es.036]
MIAILICIAAYLLGSISFSYLIAKFVKKIDIRDHGSGNAGATNTLRVLGTGPAITVLALDVIKGILAVWLGYWFSSEPIVPFLAGICAILGHNWPIFFGFRGGKGVATTIGVFATIAFLPALYAGIIAIFAIVITRFVSLGSLIFVVLTPAFIFLLGGNPASYILLGTILAILSVWRHRTNVKRLFTGTESKLGQKVEQ